ncbi:MAG: hypothetical protein Q4B66_07220, partial [Ligilactobacillus agilis]|nr:hypothetical protein [Ligilactobacillus agilis]
MRKDVTDNRKLDAQAISEVQGDTLVKNGEYSLETKEITQGGKLVAKANTFDVPYELTPEAEEKILDYIIKNMDKKDKSGKYEWLDANTVYLVDSDDLTDHLKLTYVKDDGSKVEKEMNHFYFFISFNQVNNVANPPAGAIGVDAG